MTVLDHLQNILPVFFAPAVKIFFFGVSGKINKTAFATAETGQFLFHNLFLIFGFHHNAVAQSPCPADAWAIAPICCGLIGDQSLQPPTSSKLARDYGIFECYFKDCEKNLFFEIPL